MSSSLMDPGLKVKMNNVTSTQVRLAYRQIRTRVVRVVGGKSLRTIAHPSVSCFVSEFRPEQLGAASGGRQEAAVRSVCPQRNARQGRMRSPEMRRIQRPRRAHRATRMQHWQTLDPLLAQWRPPAVRANLRQWKEAYWTAEFRRGDGVRRGIYLVPRVSTTPREPLSGSYEHSCAREDDSDHWIVVQD